MGGHVCTCVWGGHVCVCVHVCVREEKRVGGDACVCGEMFACVYTCVSVCTCVCVCVYVCERVYTHVFVCVSAHV